jgi:S-methylmethionine-dependent homocysteine/selenocysteine methylase
MGIYRDQLPQLGNELFLTDGGLETTLIFHEGIDLPLFASFNLLKTTEGTQRIKDYYRRYARIAKQNGYGFILESPTWRANADWGARLGYDAQALDRINRQGISLMEDIRNEFAEPGFPFVISGCIGPRGDGYQSSDFSAEEARAYHSVQIQTFQSTAVDFVSAVTMTNVNEALGITQAAMQVKLPVVVSFTLETDARLPSGETLAEAITAVDEASAGYPAYYMVNCAHATHFENQLPSDKALSRLRGVRANASKCSHVELDESPTLDEGNPIEFGEDYARLKQLIPKLSVVGGCCGTDHRHIERICQSLA